MRTICDTSSEKEWVVQHSQPFQTKQNRFYQSKSVVDAIFYRSNTIISIIMVLKVIKNTLPFNRGDQLTLTSIDNMKKIFSYDTPDPIFVHYFVLYNGSDPTPSENIVDFLTSSKFIRILVKKQICSLYKNIKKPCL